MADGTTSGSEDPRNRVLAPRAAWSVDLETFIGPSMISEMFSIADDDEENEIFFEAGLDGTPYWTSPDSAYEIRFAPDMDWEPPTSFLVHGGRTVGFYAGGQCWIDPAHRGKGLSTELILALVDRIGAVPYDNAEPMGFSRSGYAAHARAHRVAVERAVEAGLVPAPHLHP